MLRLGPLSSSVDPRVLYGRSEDADRQNAARTASVSSSYRIPGEPTKARPSSAVDASPRRIRDAATTIRRFTHDAVQTNVRRPSDVGRVLSLVHIDGAQRPPLHTWTSHRRKTPGTSPFSVLLPQTAGNTDYVKWWVEPGKGQVTPLPRASTPRPDDVLGAPACSRRSGRGPAMHSAPSADRTRLPDDRRARRAVRPSRRAVRTGSRGDR